ncbi:hypothetical protein G9A89_002478 [Geosiphon pyriformis]|nr:hypothetical protein G9A89_002478 [Geosiphon pyriformis]
MAMKKANHTKLQLKRKLTNLQRKSKTISPTNNNSNPKDINHPKDGIKTTLYHPLITSLRFAITVELLATGKKIAESYNKTNKIGQSYYQPSLQAYYPSRLQYQNNYYQPALQPIQQQYQQPPTQHYQILAQKLISQNQFTPQNQYQFSQNPSIIILNLAILQYLKNRIFIILIAENANLLDIFPFEFKANESPFLLSNAAANEQKAITAMYTKAEIEKKPICLILDNGSAGSIITYQLMQQLKRNVDRPAQTIIVTANGMKKTPVGEIDNFPFTIDRITIPVKVLVMDAPQY